MSPRRLAVSVSVLLFLAARAEAAEAPEGEPRVASPYFVVEGGDPAVDHLPLKSTDVDVTVVGVIADVRVRQVYVNEGSRPINTQYVFPGSTRAAVHGLTLRVGERQVRARIREKQQAQREFDQAKEEGKTASLLTEERPNVFTMRLANVMPKDRIEVQLHYSELLVPEAGVYEVVFPTVVGPRYVSPTSPQERWTATPHTRLGEEPKTAFSLRARIQAPTELFDVHSPTHKVSTQRERAQITNVSVLGEDGGTRDFILRYRLAGGAVAAGLLLSEPRDDEGFFLLTVQPPQRVKPESIPARDYVFVVDVSGSMAGFPLETAKHLLRALAAELRPTDTFNILFFSGGSQTLAPAPLPATRENVRKALAMLSDLDGGGGTELLPALQQALALPRYGSLSRSIVVITDGYVSVERQAMELISSHLGEANLFAFGIGSSVNRYLIEGLARAGKGTPFIVTDPEQAPKVAEQLSAYIKSPVLTNVKVTFDGFEVRDVEPLSVPDVLADRPVVIHGKWSGAPEGKIVVSGVTGAGKWSQTFEVGAVKPDPRNEALRYLWARERVARLSDFAQYGETPEERDAVIELGLKYELLTKYTSFIAVLEDVRNRTGAATDVDQPIPLPDGVSELAVGEVGDEPPMAWVLVLAAGLVGLALVARRRQWA